VRKTTRPKWDIDLDSLSPKQLSRYDDSIEVLKLMRNGYSIIEATKEVGITPRTAKHYIGSSLKSKNNTLVPKATDHLLRKMRIYEDGKEIWVQVKGLNKASLIGQYHSAVGKLVDSNEKNTLQPFEQIKIKEYKGRYHKLETNSKKIFKIFDQREEPEYFTIYSKK
jgi:hypothetical protein